MLQNEGLRAYVSRTAEIRRLSSPDPRSLENAEAYSEQLRQNFISIGRIAAKNRAFLTETLFPMLESPEDLSDKQIEDLSDFAAELLSLGGVEEFENLDLPLMSLVSRRLFDEVRKREDTDTIVRQLDTEIEACYSLMNMTLRVTVNPSISNQHRARGREISSFFLDYLPHDRFLELDETSREITLTNARFSAAFYERINNDYDINEQNIERLECMLALSEDLFYRHKAPHLDWRYFRYRTLEYLLRLTDTNNARGFTPEQIERIAARVDDFRELRASDPAYFGELIFAPLAPVFCARNEYLVGRLTREEYLATLLSLYNDRDKVPSESDECMFNVFIPLEMICLMGEQERTAEDDALLITLYKNLNAYIFHMQGKSSMAFMLEYFMEIVERFIEVPGGVTLERFVLQAMAAFHPPTYIHSCMVARISKCLCDHLVELAPEHLVGVVGCQDAEDVRCRRKEVVTFAYHAALSHDFGKVACIDTISVYGRKLLDFEFEIIKSHPDMGARLLAMSPKTSAYVDVARGHHRWYDDSFGYPEDFRTAESPAKPIIDIVACADCMDAATDAVGRSYAQGKTLEDYVEEVREGAGTRYAPWLVPLLDRPEVRADLKQLLKEGRQDVYRITYKLLRGVICQV